MLRVRNVLVLLAVTMIVLVGCDPQARWGKMFNPRGKRQGGPGEYQRERDPVQITRKAESGVDVNEYILVENRDGHPGNVPLTITSSGFTGLTQQTFSETGGDIHVHLNRDGTRMAFATARYSRNHQICAQGVTSKTVTLVTQDNMSDLMPKFSPDGELIAWCSNRYGNMDILVQKALATRDTRPTQLTRDSNHDVHPTWSNDQKFLAFSRFNSMDGQWQIWVMDYHTRTVSNITEGLFPEFRPIPEQDKDGTVYTIAYQRSRKRDIPWYSIWTISIRMNKNGAVEAVGSPKEIIANHQWAAITPAWSPDGQYLTFASVRKSPISQWQGRIYKADDIWVIRIDGTDLTQITRHSAPDWDPWWAMDKDDPKGPGRIYFNSERTGTANIWSVRPMVAGMLAEAGKKAAGNAAGTKRGIGE